MRRTQGHERLSNQVAISSERKNCALPNEDCDGWREKSNKGVTRHAMRSDKQRVTSAAQTAMRIINLRPCSRKLFQRKRCLPIISHNYSRVLISGHDNGRNKKCAHFRQCQHNQIKSVPTSTLLRAHLDILLPRCSNEQLMGKDSWKELEFFKFDWLNLASVIYAHCHTEYFLNCDQW